MKLLALFSLIIVTMFCIFDGGLAFAQTVTAGATAVLPAVAPELGFLDTAIKFLASIEANGWIIGLTILVEFGFRLIKTDKPKSVIYLVADGCRMIGTIANKIAELMDKVLPQRTST